MHRIDIIWILNVRTINDCYVLCKFLPILKMCRIDTGEARMLPTMLTRVFDEFSQFDQANTSMVLDKSWPLLSRYLPRDAIPRCDERWAFLFVIPKCNVYYYAQGMVSKISSIFYFS